MKMEHGGDRAGFKILHGAEPLDFSANTSPLGMPENARRAASEALYRADRYPDPLCRALREALGRHHGVPAEWIICGAGAAELIHRAVQALAPRAGLVPEPSFSEYARALKMQGSRAEHIQLEEERDFRPGSELLDGITPNIDMVFLCQPNNPTGVTADPELVRSVLGRCREMGTLLLADECFLDFLDEPGRFSLIPELGEGNLLILRAFTKFYGMAGLRLGYCITDDPDLAEKLTAHGQPWPVSAPAQAAGIAALSDREYAESLRCLIRTERAVLMEGLSRLGMRVIPGEANFLLFFSPDPELDQKLAREGVMLRNCANFPGLGQGWYRAAVRTRKENAEFLQILGRCV